MKKNSWAMTLAELSVTIAILSVVIVGMVIFFTTGIQAIKKNSIIIPAVNIINEQIEKMREMCYDTILDNYTAAEFDLNKNSVDYKMNITTKVIYGGDLVDVTIKLKWETAGYKGKQEIKMETFIYTAPTP